MGQTNPGKNNLAFVATKRLINSWFNRLNQDIFDNKLQPFSHILIDDALNEHGKVIYAYTEADGVNTKLLIRKRFNSQTQFIAILAHEMIHNYQWATEKTMNHSRATFHKWKQKFEDNGIALVTIYEGPKHV